MLVSLSMLFYRFVNYFVVRLLFLFYCRFFKPEPFFQAKIAFIKIDALGDFILWLNCAEALSQNFSIQEKVLICSTQVKELALSLKLFDTIIAIDDKKYIADPLYRFLVYRELRDYSFQDVFQCNFSRSFWIHDDLASILRSKRKVAPKGDLLASNKWLHAFGLNSYTEVAPNCRQSFHQIEKIQNGENLSVKV